MLNGIRARVGAGRPASSRRSFFLDEEPMPKVLPGQGHDDDVQLLVADGPGDGPEERGELELAGDDDGWEPLSVREARRRAAECLPETVAVTLDNRAAVHVPGALGPTPLADELRRDRELLLDANGRLVAHIRTLEKQLRAAGIEPAARE